MKPASFEYFAPEDIDEVIELLDQRAGDAKLLAGGQSLVPAMNFRLATPAAIVDLNRVGGLDNLRVEEGELVIDMLVRHRALERKVLDDPLGKLLAQVSHFVGHLPIRVRGTVAGSLAHADPAAEWCLVAIALNATIVARSLRGERRIPATDFFEGLFTTALEPNEVITQVRLPLLGRAGTGFCEKSHTAGDFATIATVAVLQLDDGLITDARVGVAGAESRPVRADRAETELQGSEATPEALAGAAHSAAEAVDPISDAFCSADYRRHLVEVLTRRALESALEAASA